MTPEPGDALSRLAARLGCPDPDVFMERFWGPMSPEEKAAERLSFNARSAAMAEGARQALETLDPADSMAKVCRKILFLPEPAD